MAPKPPPPKVRGQTAAKQRAAEEKRTSARSTTLEAGRQLQRILQSAPGASAASSVAIDAAAKRSAERLLNLAGGIELHIPVGLVRERDVDARVAAMQRQLSHTASRGSGEDIHAGDEVQLDLLGYLGGDVFLAETDTWYRVTPNRLLPGLFEALVGQKVPGQRLINVTLPPDYPVAQQAGRTVVFAVAIRAARARKVPAVTDPIFVAVTNNKKLADLRAELKKELIVIRGQQMVEHARLLLLRELYIKSMGDEVPGELVDEELTRQWRGLQGESQARQGVPLPAQKKSQQAYLQDPTLRGEARRIVWEQRALEALAATLGLEVNDDELKKTLAVMFGSLDLDGILYRNPGLHKDLLRGLRLRKAQDVLLARATIAFDAPPSPPGTRVTPLVPPDEKTGVDRMVVTTTRGLKRPPSKTPPS
ncbi:MAG: trigger factor [Deltaproteobacteria bacterium]|nr:trigger factor [Deltaproteobacteria bacterium]